MTRIILAFLLLIGFVPLYLAGNLLLVAWIRRRARGWLRAAKLFALRQVRPLTAARVRVTCLAHVVAFAVLVVGLRQRLEIVQVALLLLTYVFVVAALTLSLLAKMPAFRRIWSDPFMKLLLLGTPFVLAYLTRGYSQMWLDETLTFGSENAPMAHFAGTVMLAGFAAAIVLLVFALAFEFAMIFMPALPTSPTKRRRSTPSEGKPRFRSMVWALFSPKLDLNSREHREWRSTARALGLGLLFSCSFLGCYSGVQAAVSPLRTGFGKLVLAAIAFDFDAAPAERCALKKNELPDAVAKQPKLKAVMLATSQEKAVLVRRSPHLFDPVMMSSLAKEDDRALVVERPVSCFEVTPSNVGTP